MIAIERSAITNEAQLRDEARHEILEKKGAYEGDQRIKGILSKIGGPAGNFSLLQSIINRHLEKSGLTTGQNLNDFLIVQMPSDADTYGEFMSCDLRAKVIEIYDEKLIEGSKVYGVNLEQFVLHTFVHEVGHAVSFDNRSIIETPQGAYLHRRAGVEHRLIPAQPVVQGDSSEQKETRQAVWLYTFLNEAINDEFAEDVSRELGERAKIASEPQLDAFYKKWGQSGNYYGQTRRLLRGMVRQLAKDTGVAEQAAKNALKHACLVGLNVSNTGENSSGIFDESIGEGFTKDIGGIGDIKQLPAIMKKYSLERTYERLLNDAKMYLGSAKLRFLGKIHGRTSGQPGSKV